MPFILKKTQIKTNRNLEFSVGLEGEVNSHDIKCQRYHWDHKEVPLLEWEDLHVDIVLDVGGEVHQNRETIHHAEEYVDHAIAVIELGLGAVQDEYGNKFGHSTPEITV